MWDYWGNRMAKVTVPDEIEKKIIQQNGLNPEKYGVMYRDEKTILLLCYDTRDYIEILKGDRPWC